MPASNSVNACKVVWKMVGTHKKWLFNMLHIVSKRSGEARLVHGNTWYIVLPIAVN